MARRISDTLVGYHNGALWSSLAGSLHCLSSHLLAIGGLNVIDRPGYQQRFPIGQRDAHSNTLASKHLASFGNADNADNRLEVEWVEWYSTAYLMELLRCSFEPTPSLAP